MHDLSYLKKKSWCIYPLLRELLLKPLFQEIVSKIERYPLDQIKSVTSNEPLLLRFIQMFCWKAKERYRREVLLTRRTRQSNKGSNKNRGGLAYISHWQACEWSHRIMQKWPMYEWHTQYGSIVGTQLEHLLPSLFMSVTDLWRHAAWTGLWISGVSWCGIPEVVAVLETLLLTSDDLVTARWTISPFKNARVSLPDSRHYHGSGVPYAYFDRFVKCFHVSPWKIEKSSKLDMNVNKEK